VPAVEAVRAIARHGLGPDVLGARMVGGGWGGGILVATRRPVPASRWDTIVRRATAATGRSAAAFAVVAADGARVLDVAALA